MPPRKGKEKLASPAPRNTTSRCSAPITSVFSFKGGVGKTTITANIASTLACAGWRVLLVDADPQANLTGFITRYVAKDKDPLDDKAARDLHDEHDPKDTLPRGFLKHDTDIQDVEPIHVANMTGITLADLLQNAEQDRGPEDLKKQYGEVMLVAGYPKLGLIQGTPDIVDYEAKVAKTPDTATDTKGKKRVARFRSYITHLSEGGYDMVLMDLPPSVSDLNKLFMVSSDYIMMPVVPDHFSGDTLWQLFNGRGQKESVVKKLSSYLQAASVDRDEEDEDQDVKPCLNRWSGKGSNKKFDRTIKFFPILLNMCNVRTLQGSAILTKHSTKWYKGYERMLEDVKLPPGFAWHEDSRRIVAAFVDCPAMKKKLQIEKLPVALSDASNKSVELYRTACRAVCNMLVKAEHEALESLNPFMASIFKDHKYEVEDRCRLRQLMPSVLQEKTRERNPLDVKVISLLERILQSSKELEVKTTGTTGTKKLTFADCLFHGNADEVWLCEQMDTFSDSESSEDGWRIRFDGRRENTDCSVLGDNKVEARLEVKLIDSTTPKDFGRDMVDKTKQMTGPFQNGLKAYGLVFERKVDREDNLKTAVLFKMVPVKINGREIPTVQTVCFIPCWNHSSPSTGRAERGLKRKAPQADPASNKTARENGAELDGGAGVGVEQPSPQPAEKLNEALRDLKALRDRVLTCARKKLEEHKGDVRLAAERSTWQHLHKDEIMALLEDEGFCGMSGSKKYLADELARVLAKKSKPGPSGVPPERVVTSSKRRIEAIEDEDAIAASVVTHAAETSGSSAPLPSQQDEDGMPQLRDPTAEEQEVIEAMARLRNAKKQDETEVQGWKISLKVRERGQTDITAVPPEGNKKLRSVPEVKRHMGILK